jgi:hypothetical protein
MGQATSIRHPASGIRHPASGIRHPASGMCGAMRRNCDIGDIRR